MLVNGDLVRIPQGTVIMDVDTDPTPLQVATHPKVGIIIDKRDSDVGTYRVLNDSGQIMWFEREYIENDCEIISEGSC